MWRRLGLFLLPFLLFSALIHFPSVTAQPEDVVEGEDEGKVEDEGAETINTQETKEGKPKGKADVTATDKDLDDEEVVKPIGPSPDAEAYVLFTKPTSPKEIPAGKSVHVLVGLYNKGEESFFVETLDGAFHYPMDHSFHIRNFTHFNPQRLVESKTEATFDYAFTPHDDLAGRPFGLRINLNYRSLNGTKFSNAVFNETVQVVEDESGLNPEMGFMYVLMGCLAVLLLLLGQQLLQKMRKKAGMSSKKRDTPVEMGTVSGSDIDWEWIPKEVLNHGNKSPRSAGSPKKSPRQRKSKRGNRGDSGDSDYDS